MEEKEQQLALIGPEQRIVTQTPVLIESRGEGDTKQDYIVGCAIKYGVRSQLLGWFYEIIDERALDTTDMSDVVGLFNHDSNIILGRSTAGTLTLEKRSDGLYFMVPYDALDPDHVRVRRKIEKKEVVGCSFQFTIAREGTRWSTDPETDMDVRTVTNIAKLYDVGPVTFPAYTQTNTGIDKRSLDALRAECDAAKRNSAEKEGRMKGMGKKKEKKSGTAYDESFIDEMIPHHQSAIEMAKEALDKAEHQDLKDLAQNIIDSQSAEIEKMQAWKEEWFPAQNSERQAELPVEDPTQQQNQQDAPVVTVAPLSVYERQLQLLKQP